MIIRNWKLRRPHPIYQPTTFQIILFRMAKPIRNPTRREEKEEVEEEMIQYIETTQCWNMTLNCEESKNEPQKLESTFNSKPSGYRNCLFVVE